MGLDTISNAKELMVNISRSFPGLFTFMSYLAVFLAVFFTALVFIFWARDSLGGNAPKGRLGYMAGFLILLFSGMLGSLGLSLETMAETWMGQGYGGLFPPSAIEAGSDRLLLDFAEQGLSLTGWAFGFWGLVTLIVASLPGSEIKRGAGWVRLCLAPFLILSVPLAEKLGVLSYMNLNI